MHHKVIVRYTVAEAMIREGKVANKGKGVHAWPHEIDIYAYTFIGIPQI